MARRGSERIGTTRRVAMGAWMLCWSYTPAAAAIGVYAARPSAWSFALAFVVVAARQNALFVVAHESWHNNLFPWRRINDAMGAWLASYPVVLPHWQARHAHLQHHRTVGTMVDPDRYAWGWATGERWAWLRHLLGVATGLPFVVRAARRLLRLPPPAGGPAARVVFSVPRGRLDPVKLAAVHAALLGLFTATVGPWLYFALWLLPAISLRMGIDELRQFLEHRGGRLITYRAGPLERFVLGPFNFHLHAFHHAIASEPWFRLPAIGAEARRRTPGIMALDSYGAELLAYLRGRDTPGRMLSGSLPRDAAGSASSSTGR